MDLILKPVRVATSKPARQTYMNTILFMITSAILLGLAIFAYVLFYFNYVPQIGIERVIHLQYGDGPHPYGIASLGTSLISQQAYDISLSLHVPRSPPNIAQGNFMLSLSLLSPSYISTPPLPTTQTPSLTTPNPISAISPSDILFSSRRPAILTYTSRLISLSDRLLSLPLYILNLRTESETLLIPMAEYAIFPKGRSRVPGYALLELQASQQIQVYDVHLHFTARFGGLRWLMYNYRILSFLVFTTAFWGFEVLFAGLGWLGLSVLFSDKKDTKSEAKEEEEETSTIKNEDDDLEEPDLSDTPRTFPTYGRQQPLRYTPPAPKIKKEEEGEDVIDDTAIQSLGAAEADDEDEERGGRSGRDSGIGTSFSEAGERSGLARRRSKGKGMS